MLFGRLGLVAEPAVVLGRVGWLLPDGPGWLLGLVRSDVGNRPFAGDRQQHRRQLGLDQCFREPDFVLGLGQLDRLGSELVQLPGLFVLPRLFVFVLLQPSVFQLVLFWPFLVQLFPVRFSFSQPVPFSDFCPFLF